MLYTPSGSIVLQKAPFLKPLQLQRDTIANTLIRYSASAPPARDVELFCSHVHQSLTDDVIDYNILSQKRFQSSLSAFQSLQPGTNSCRYCLLGLKRQAQAKSFPLTGYLVSMPLKQLQPTVTHKPTHASILILLKEPLDQGIANQPSSRQAGVITITITQINSISSQNTLRTIKVSCIIT